MKKLLMILALCLSSNLSAQYCLFFDIKVDEPEMVVSAMTDLMNTDWGKNLQATKSLFAYGPNGTNEATHSIQFCFPNEAAFENAFMSYGQSKEAQMLWERKLEAFSSNISQTLNTPIWYNGEDWAEDNVFMIYQMEVSDPGVYLNEYKDFAQNMAKKLNYTDRSYGLAMPIVGKTADYTHFVWMGHPDVKTALSNAKQMMSDPLYAKFAKNVADIRTMVNSLMLIRLADF
jgi:hypothetical protein